MKKNKKRSATPLPYLTMTAPPWSDHGGKEIGVPIALPLLKSIGEVALEVYFASDPRAPKWETDKAIKKLRGIVHGAVLQGRVLRNQWKAKAQHNAAKRRADKELATEYRKAKKEGKRKKKDGRTTVCVFVVPRHG